MFDYWKRSNESQVANIWIFLSKQIHLFSIAMFSDLACFCHSFCLIRSMLTQKNDDIFGLTFNGNVTCHFPKWNIQLNFKWAYELWSISWLISWNVDSTVTAIRVHKHLVWILNDCQLWSHVDFFVCNAVNKFSQIVPWFSKKIWQIVNALSLIHVHLLNWLPECEYTVWIVGQRL